MDTRNVRARVPAQTQPSSQQPLNSPLAVPATPSVRPAAAEIANAPPASARHAQSHQSLRDANAETPARTVVTERTVHAETANVQAVLTRSPQAAKNLYAPLNFPPAAATLVRNAVMERTAPVPAAHARAARTRPSPLAIAATLVRNAAMERTAPVPAAHARTALTRPSQAANAEPTAPNAQVEIAAVQTVRAQDARSRPDAAAVQSAKRNPTEHAPVRVNATARTVLPRKDLPPREISLAAREQLNEIFSIARPK
ncbi:hypothetical protein QFC21_006736 [Naganishia friedmannii]|uniref:Uncharacterized protein n=1 Tax=Naganishia friedmannii TaxID=89922 RepID=A0ACC2V1F4_9TREE|nr:hypothetical protein QFC21_006736 [Naganishia friedmannii]